MRRIEESLAAARTEDGPAQPARSVDVALGANPLGPQTHGEIDEPPIDEPLIPLLDADRFEVVGGGHLRHRPEGGIHPGGISA